MVPPATPARPRTREDKLYQAVLDICTQGVGQLEVSPRSGAETASAFTTATATQTVKQQPPHSRLPSLSSLPPTPPSPRKPSISSTTTSEHSTMNRNPLPGDPPRGPRTLFSYQDARSGSNLAVQPAAPSAQGISLKKPSVKIARPAGPAPAVSRTPASPTPPSTHAPPVIAAPRAEDGHAAPKPTTGKPGMLSITTGNTNSYAVSPSAAAAAALEELFARLTSTSPSASSTPATPSRVFHSAFADNAPTSDSATLASPEVLVQKPASPLVAIKEEPSDEVQMPPALDKPEVHSAEKSTSVKAEDVTGQDLEREYLRKASEYLMALSSNAGPTVELTKAVITKLRRLYAPSEDLKPDTVEELKARFVDALVTALEGLSKRQQSITKSQIEEILAKVDGDFLYLCAVLAMQELIAIDTLDEVVAVGKVVLDVLPQDQDTAKAAPGAQEPKSTDPLDGMKAWPAQEKRENSPECRTVFLKGVSGIDNINKLQALVWGGRVESLQLPQPGAGHAIVKFLTPEACETYFNATENGITIPGTKTVILVEKGAGPNSTNDVIRSCIEGDVTRCVRAYDADEDWGDMILMKLARGKGQNKREVDRIKRGKTAKGRFFIEFRFAAIYNAINFFRQLKDDEPDWEHCTLAYAPDPCETAQGVHFKDEDETEKAGGFW